MTYYSDAKRIMGKNCIGPDELEIVSSLFPILLPKTIPEIPFSKSELLKKNKTHLLIFGASAFENGTKLTLNTLRQLFGVDPTITEPCLYNQDWYIKEKFASTTNLGNGWYLVKKSIVASTQGKIPSNNAKLPSAILLTYTFFANWFVTGGNIIFKNEYVWCSDTDANGDRVYVGRYVDPKKINKNGFNIHRHLSITKQFGCI